MPLYDDDMEKRILRLFRSDNLPNESMKDVSNCCGNEVAGMLIVRMPGSKIYVPQYSIKNIFHDLIRENPDLDIEDAVHRLHLSRATAYRYLDSKKK